MATKKTRKKTATKKAATRKQPIDTSHRPVIELSTLSKRTTISIDGEPYEIRNQRELSVLQLQRMEAIGGVLTRVGTVPSHEQTADDDRAASKALDEACRMVLIAPDEVHDKLCDADRLQINTVFIMASGAQAAGAGAGRKTAAK